MSDNHRTLLFMVILSFVCALILSVLASALKEPKAVARELDRSEQMMIAAKLLTHEGRLENDGFASDKEIMDVYNQRLKPFLVNDKGERKTFEELKINQNQYISEFRKSGYYKQPWKLVYEIKSKQENKADGYVLPVNGYGLWDAIYGYMAIQPDGDTVIGITWYDQKETPGLGANIADASWQDLFPGKKIFQMSSDGKTNFQSAPLGITVVKGKVADVYGNSYKAKSAVDGMSGATLTGNGVSDAYREVLQAYRPFLIKLREEHS
jgi:Na+-transporting NADH:ubiquinone oxidoreductase subunit C